MNTNEMKPSEILDKALALLDNGKRWITGAYARNKDNKRVLPTDTDACNFCMLGAIFHTANARHPSGAALEALQYLRIATGGVIENSWLSIANRNDTAKSFDDVAASFNKAIALAKEQGE